MTDSTLDDITGSIKFLFDGKGITDAGAALTDLHQPGRPGGNGGCGGSGF
jgi:hypothetical protein